MTVDQLIEAVGSTENVCFTGGEPLEQPDAAELLQRLVDAGKTVVLETNGSKDLSDVPASERIIISMDIKCPSSGMQDRMCMSNLGILSMKDQLKFVISDRTDLIWYGPRIPRGGGRLQETGCQGASPAAQDNLGR